MVFNELPGDLVVLILDRVDLSGLAFLFSLCTSSFSAKTSTNIIIIDILIEYSMLS